MWPGSPYEHLMIPVNRGPAGSEPRLCGWLELATESLAGSFTGVECEGQIKRASPRYESA